MTLLLYIFLSVDNKLATHKLSEFRFRYMTCLGPLALRAATHLKLRRQKEIPQQVLSSSEDESDEEIFGLISINSAFLKSYHRTKLISGYIKTVYRKPVPCEIVNLFRLYSQKLEH